MQCILFSVDSNDKLYGAGQKFINEVVKIIDTLVKEIFEQLKSLSDKVKITFIVSCLISSISRTIDKRNNVHFCRQDVVIFILPHFPCYNLSTKFP